MPIVRAATLRRVTVCVAEVLVPCACDGPQRIDSAGIEGVGSALRTPGGDAPDAATAAQAEHATFVAGTFDARLELGGLRLTTDTCEGDPDACVPKPRPQVFVASLDAHGRARWLISPLQPSGESRLHDTQVRAAGILVLAAYRGALPMHSSRYLSGPNEQGLVLFELDAQGTLARAHKVAGSDGVRDARLVSDAQGQLGVIVTFQGRLDLPDQSVSAGGGGGRVRLSLDPTMEITTLGQLEELPTSALQCSKNGSLCAIMDIPPPLGCDLGICSKDPFCCHSSWDALCVTEVTERVASTSCNCTHEYWSTGLRLPRGCQNSRDLDNDCPTVICDKVFGDAYCCDTYWDSICVSEASEVCGGS